MITKKEENGKEIRIITTAILTFLIILAVLFFVGKVKITGFVVVTVCAEDIAEDSVLGNNLDGCDLGYGVLFSVSDIQLDCKDYSIFGAATDGLKVDGKTGIKIIDCSVSGFTNNYHFLNGASGIILSSTTAGITVEDTSLADVQWCLTINVTNGTSPISGATVNVAGLNNKFYSSTTDANGLAYFNASEKEINSTGITTFTPYDILVTKAGYNDASDNGVAITSDTYRLITLTPAAPSTSEADRVFLEADKK